MRSIRTRVPPTLPLVLGLLLAALAAAPALAQERATVTGRVVDARTGAPVVGAEVVPLAPGVRGAHTGSDGGFVLRGVPAGERGVVVRMMGYRTATRLVQATGETFLEDVRLEPDPVMLTGITATVDRFRRAVRASGHHVDVLDRGGVLRASASSARFLVQSRIGGTRVPCPAYRGWLTDSGDCVLVRGRVVRSVLYVDGRPAMGGWSELDALSPREIYWAESHHGGSFVHVVTVRHVENLSRVAAAQAARRAERAAARARRTSGAPVENPVLPPVQM